MTTPSQSQADKAALEAELGDRPVTPQWLQSVVARGLTSRPEISDPGCKGLRIRIEPQAAIFRWYVAEKLAEGATRSRAITIGEFTLHAFPGKMKLSQAQGWLVRLREANRYGRLADVEKQLEEEKGLRPEFAAAKAVADERTVAFAIQQYWDNVICGGPSPRKEKSRRQPRRALFAVLLPALGKRTLRDMEGREGPELIGDVIAGIARGTPVWAATVFSMARQLFKYCRGRGWMVYNPVDALDSSMLGASKGKRGKRTLSPDELRLFWFGLDSKTSSQPHGIREATRWALRLALLIPDRSGELFLAEKREFDLEAGVWTVPAEHQKACSKEAKENVEDMPVPLSWLALEVVKRLFAIDPHSKWLLPATQSHSKRGHLNENTCHKAMSRIFGNKKTKAKGYVQLPGGPVSPHDLRRTFASRSEDAVEDGGLGLDEKAVEACLSHSLGKTKIGRTYRTGKLFAQRKATLAAWADYVADRVGIPRPGRGANVVPLRAVQ